MKNEKRPLFVEIFMIGLFILSACSGEGLPAGITIVDTEPTESIIPEEILVEESAEPMAGSIHSPSARRYHSFAYDNESQQIIMVGGQSEFVVDLSMLGHDNTWAYDVNENAWEWMNPPVEPPKIYGSQLGYDLESDRVVFYGGGYGLYNEAKGIGETWAYDFNSNTWEQKSEGPLNHFGARIVYDSESDKFILFGGCVWNFTSTSHTENVDLLFDETWIYDLNSDTWTQMMPDISPPGRWYQPMAYDSKADRVIMWGGTDQDGKAADDGTVWLYDYNNNTWEGIPPAEDLQPDPDREGAAMVYDTESDRMILYSGDTNGSETWAYDLNTNTWTLMDSGQGPAGSINLSFFAMAYVPEIDRVILSGGNHCDKSCTYLEGLWSYDYNTNTWTNLTL